LGVVLSSLWRSHYTNWAIPEVLTGLFGLGLVTVGKLRDGTSKYATAVPFQIHYSEEFNYSNSAVISYVVLYGCETWFLYIRQERGLRKTLGPKRE